MRSAAVRTSPVPHSKACDTFRASDASAVGTGLGSPFLADDFESNSVPQGFIAELLPQHRPAGVEHGFCHPRLRQSGRVHVANNHTAMLAHKLRRFLMQKMLPAILRPGVQCSRTAFLSSSLCQGQFRLVPPIEGGHLDPAPVRECSEVFQAKVDRDRGAFLRLSLSHLDRNVPVSKLVNSLKGVSSRLLREHRPEISGRYKDGVLWSPSYFAGSCGGAPLSVIAEYIRNQRGPRLLPALNGGVSGARAKMSRFKARG